MVTFVTVPKSGIFIIIEVEGLVVAVRIIGSPAAAAAEGRLMEFNVGKVNGIPEKIAKAKRANVPLRTLRIGCFS
jgi:hypothetical protein